MARKVKTDNRKIIFLGSLIGISVGLFWIWRKSSAEPLPEGNLLISLINQPGTATHWDIALCDNDLTQPYNKLQEDEYIPVGQPAVFNIDAMSAVFPLLLVRCQGDHMNQAGDAWIQDFRWQSFNPSGSDYIPQTQLEEAAFSGSGNVLIDVATSEFVI